MAREGMQLQDGVCKAGADLSANQFYAVKLTGANQVGLVAASADLAYGILQNKPTSGQVADVACEGICKAKAGAAITAGAKVMVDTTGKLITFVGSAGNTLMGEAVDAAGGDGQLFTLRILIHPLLT